MWHSYIILRLLSAIPEDVVESHCIYLAAFLAQPFDQEFDCVHRTRANLHLLRREGRNQIPHINTCGELFAVTKHTVQPEDVGYDIIGEDGQVVQISEIARGPPIKG